MSIHPTLELNDNMIIVHIGNSLKNSALLIYKIEYTIDTTMKVVGLRGFQAVNKEYKNSFELQINGFSKEQLDRYDYFWIDPNDSKMKMKIKK